MPKEDEDNNTKNPKLPFSEDVYESSKKLNRELATKGPAVLYGLTKAGGQLANSNLVTGVGGVVIGGIGFFGNEYYRRKGDDSAYTYMGQGLGAAQLVGGILLIGAEAASAYMSDDASKALALVNLGIMSLSLFEGAMVLVNSYLYSDDSPKSESSVKPQ
jgi:hypothetical protein